MPVDDNYFEELPPSGHRGLYRDFYCAYLSHPPDSEEAKGLRGKLDHLLSFGKISPREAAALESELSSTRERVERELQEAVWGQRLGFRLKLQY